MGGEIDVNTAWKTVTLKAMVACTLSLFLTSLHIVTFKINHQRIEWEEHLIVTQDLHHETNAETKLWPLCLFMSTSLFINSFIVEQNSLRSSKSPS